MSSMDNRSTAGGKLESKSLKKNVSKMAFRSKEMMLRTFGRVGETKDEIMDNYVHLLTKQQNQACKFQRELKNYMNSLNAMKAASTLFYQSINGIYEDDWKGKEVITGLAKKSDDLYDDLYSKLNDAINSSLPSHSAQCKDIHLKVDKRGRKLVDFDAARRTCHSVESAKKVDDGKVSRARDQVETSGKTYESLNGELHKELPDLYDARLPLYANVITSISTAENAFYGEQSEIRGRLLATVEVLKNEYENGEYRIQRLYSPAFSSMKQKVRLHSQHDDAATLPCNDRLATANGADNGDLEEVEKAHHSGGTDKKNHATDEHVVKINGCGGSGDDVAAVVACSSENKSPASTKAESSQQPLDDVAKSSLRARPSNDYINVKLSSQPAAAVSAAADSKSAGNTQEPAGDDVTPVQATPHRKAPVAKQRVHPGDYDDGEDTSDTSDESDTEFTASDDVAPNEPLPPPPPAPPASVATPASTQEVKPITAQPPPPPPSSEPPSPVVEEVVAEAVVKEPELLAKVEPAATGVGDDSSALLPHDEVPVASTAAAAVEQQILPPHYLFTVQAQHPYTGDDEDELTFDKGDIIYVVEFSDPDEQDEGWQMGILKNHWESDANEGNMGLFPENFTKRTQQ